MPFRIKRYEKNCSRILTSSKLCCTFRTKHSAYSELHKSPSSSARIVWSPVECLGPLGVTDSHLDVWHQSPPALVHMFPGLLHPCITTVDIKVALVCWGSLTRYHRVAYREKLTTSLFGGLLPSGVPGETLIQTPLRASGSLLAIFNTPWHIEASLQCLSACSHDGLPVCISLCDSPFFLWGQSCIEWEDALLPCELASVNTTHSGTVSK